MAKQIAVAIAVTIMATIYSFDCATPYIRELPSVNKVGRYLFVLGSKPTIYETRTITPVPRSTPVLDADIVEKRVIKEMTNTPNNHQHTTESRRFCATELSQKYEL